MENAVVFQDADEDAILKAFDVWSDLAVALNYKEVDVALEEELTDFVVVTLNFIQLAIGRELSSYHDDHRLWRPVAPCPATEQTMELTAVSQEEAAAAATAAATEHSEGMQEEWN